MAVLSAWLGAAVAAEAAWCRGFGAVPGRCPRQGLPFQLSCPVPRFALEKLCWWFLERDPSNPPSENNKPKPVIAFGLEQFELGVNWPRKAWEVLWAAGLCSLELCRGGTAALGGAERREIRGWGTQTGTPAFALQPSSTNMHYPVSQNEAPDAQGSAGTRPGVNPQLGNRSCCCGWMVPRVLDPAGCF